MSDTPFRVNRVITTGNVSGIQQPVKRDTMVRSSFGEVFQKTLERQSQELRFSKHAEERMRMRNLHLTREDIDKLNRAVATAEQKGVKDTLILTKNMAFIVNVPNKTVITAVDGDSMKDNVFTNIDGAVIV